ncbi:MAG TPA: dephospho-CoA kinase [Gemmatimonadales bacterium]|nr:dephospho-CoA kinase [Gemmatimonadales bacterium]
MLHVALTGNVAAGKSTVAEHFRAWGATLIDADRLVREVQRPGSPVLAAIADRFGRDLLLADGSLDRAGLRRRVMGEATALAALNAIVHPAVQRRRAELHAEAVARGDLVVVDDIPLLFEALDPAAFDVVVLVDAPAALRRRRLIELRGLPAEEADRLIGSQLPAEGKRARSHYVIDNAGDLAELERRTHAVWRELRARAAARAREPGLERLLAVFAHPDDESFGPGGTLARYADAGVDVHLLCATSGERASRRAGLAAPRALARRRERELLRAAEVLGLRGVRLLRRGDGTLRADDPEGPAAVARVLGEIRPQAVIAFGAGGITAHPDHVAVGAWARAACARVGTPTLYYEVERGSLEQRSHPRIAGIPAEGLPVRIDVRPWVDVKVAAIRAHASQRHVLDLDDPRTRAALGEERFAVEGDAAPRRTLLAAPRTQP